MRIIKLISILFLSLATYSHSADLVIGDIAVNIQTPSIAGLTFTKHVQSNSVDFVANSDSSIVLITIQGSKMTYDKFMKAKISAIYSKEMTLPNPDHGTLLVSKPKAIFETYSRLYTIKTITPNNSNTVNVTNMLLYANNKSVELEITFDANTPLARQIYTDFLKWGNEVFSQNDTGEIVEPPLFEINVFGSLLLLPAPFGFEHIATLKNSSIDIVFMLPAHLRESNKALSIRCGFKNLAADNFIPNSLELFAKIKEGITEPNENSSITILHDQPDLFIFKSIRDNSTFWRALLFIKSRTIMLETAIESEDQNHVMEARKLLLNWTKDVIDANNNVESLFKTSIPFPLANQTN